MTRAQILKYQKHHNIFTIDLCQSNITFWSFNPFLYTLEFWVTCFCWPMDYKTLGLVALVYYTQGVDGVGGDMIVLCVLIVFLVVVL